MQQIHHQRWQLRRLALPTCVSTALEGTPYASGNNSFPTPIKSSASPWRLQGGCQLKSIVPVVCVAGTAARGGWAGIQSSSALCSVQRVSQVRKQHWPITNFIHCWMGDRSCSSARGEDSGAQLSSPVIFSLFPPCLSGSRADILYFPLCKLTRINTSLKAAAYTALQPSRHRPSLCRDRCKLFK